VIVSNAGLGGLGRVIKPSIVVCRARHRTDRRGYYNVCLHPAARPACAPPSVAGRGLLSGRRDSFFSPFEFIINIPHTHTIKTTAPVSLLGRRPTCTKTHTRTRVYYMYILHVNVYIYIYIYTRYTSSERPHYIRNARTYIYLYII